jgi:HD-like signal output (HDOD) protein
MKVYEEHSSEKFWKFLTGFGSLPIVSKYAQKAIRMMSEETDVDFTTISKIIDRDPGIASRIVIMANSAAYQSSARSKKVSTTKEAIIRIGITGAKTIILNESIYDFIKGGDKGSLQKPELKYVKLQRATTGADIYHI